MEMNLDLSYVITCIVAGTSLLAAITALLREIRYWRNKKGPAEAEGKTSD